MKAHPLNQSPFYKLRSRQRLAKILSVDLPALEQSANAPAKRMYRLFPIERNGKSRDVQWPKALMQRLHGRVCNLLTRIEIPDYLHSATKGRSYLTNARAHLGEGAATKVDVRSFFPSVTRSAVEGFFLQTMECSPDVAALLAKLLTVNGHLPTGSSVSPILSYYAHRDMFEEIAAMAEARDITMTCYVDDLCFSGPSVTRKFLAEVRAVIHRHGLVSHKLRFFAPRVPKVVTGVVVKRDGLALPNRRHKRISDDYGAYAAALTVREKLTLLTPLIGRVHEAAQIDPRWLTKARELVKQQRELRRQQMLEERARAATVPTLAEKSERACA